MNALRSLKTKGTDSHSVYMAVILNALTLDVCNYTGDNLGRGSDLSNPLCAAKPQRSIHVWVCHFNFSP